MRAYASQAFILSIQDSFSQLGTNRLHHNQSPEVLMLHDLCHLLSVFHLVEFHMLY